MSKYRVIESQGSWVVRIEYNDHYGDPGITLYGPFLTEAEAKDFEAYWAEDNLEVEDVSVLFLNNVHKVERG